MLGEYPGLEVAPIEVTSSIAMDVEALSDAFLKSGCGQADREYGAGRQVGLDRLVQQRVGGIRNQPVPFLPRDAYRKIIWIKCGTAGHRQNFSRPWVHGDNRPVLPFQRLLRSYLDIQV